MANQAKIFPVKGPIYIIAEVANAAQGEFAANLELIEAAKGAGADAIKFQFYKYDELATPGYGKYEIYKKTFYTFDERSRFVEKACECDLDVWIDIFDRWGLDAASRLKDKIFAVKIPPTVILDTELVNGILGLGLPAAIGVGGYEDEEIEDVLSAMSDFDNPVLLMYGFQGFPTPIEDASLGRVGHLKGKFGYQIGFADHVSAELGLAIHMPAYAFFAGCSVIEKHITLDRSDKGLDYYSALEPKEFRKMVENLSECVRIHGSGHITRAEKDYLAHATRITTMDSVRKGELILPEEVRFRRTNVSDALFPNEFDDYFPAIALRDISANVGVTKQDIRRSVAGVVVVCRLNSTRLPRKALLELNGVPAIERCLLNTLASKFSAMTILATSTDADDEELKNHTLNGMVKFFAGSANDPASRMYDAAKLYGLDYIVRVTGDSPAISYELIDLLLESHIRNKAEFSYLNNAPSGTRPEVISTNAIKKLRALINTDGYSEYLTIYFKNNPEHFSLNEVSAPKKYRFPQYRLNLDYLEDYELIKKVYEELDVGAESLSLTGVIEFLRKHPEVAEINAGIKPKYFDGEFAEFINNITKIKD